MKIADIRRAWIYYKNAKTIFNIHSTFIYDFINEVLDTNKVYYAFKGIEAQRKQLLQSQDTIEFLEFGAGSKSMNNTTKLVSNIASSSLSRQNQCRILFNIIERYRPQRLLEIGTSLGISTAYLASANSKSKLITLEGNPSSIRIAKGLFETLKLSNIEIIEGEFGTTLHHALTKLGGVDFAFLDGNHRKKATMDYFGSILPYINTNSILAIDDIYWSDEMLSAWEVLKTHPSVAFTIDLYSMGLLFFDHTIMNKQHFCLIEYKWKPWKVGIFG